MKFQIAGRWIGPGEPPYIISELSANHNGSLKRMLNLIDKASETGCDAIKIQTYTPDSLTIDCDSPDFQIKEGLWAGKTLYKLYQEAHTPLEWHPAIFDRAKKNNLTIFSSPFDEQCVDFLEQLNVPAYKVASFEITDLPLIAHIAKKGKPIIMSTGMANLSDIESAVNVAKKNGCSEIALLHCISSYPAPIADANVAVVPHLAKTFATVSGLSDHTLENTAAITSIALGGSIIEKHMTISRSEGGPDAEFSLEPNEFKSLVKSARDTWKAVGYVGYSLKNSEKSNANYRRSLYVIRDVKKGEEFTELNIKSIRPGFGLEPAYKADVMNSIATSDIMRGTPLKKTHYQLKNYGKK